MTDLTHQPYQVMPPLSAEEYEALKADIAARGVMVPVEYDEFGSILDGHHRVQICQELGLSNWPRLVRYGLDEAEKRRHARRLNLDRRHLDREQRRTLIAEDLRESPQSSNRAIAAGLNVDDKTVASVRRDLEATAEIPQLTERQGRDSRTRRITQFVPATEEEERGLQLSAKQLNARRDEQQRQERRNLAQALSDTSAELTGRRKVACIYADPAWRRKAGEGNRSYENKYRTMTWDEIMALPVKDLLLPDAWGYIWIPRAHMLALHPVKYEVQTDDGEIVTVTIPTPLIWAIARAWGFDAYSTCFVWTKTDEEHPDELGTGLVVRDQDEILCLFKRGRGLPKPANCEKFGSNHRERSGEHSAKPAFYRQMIATMVGKDDSGAPLRVLELFARDDPNNPLPPNWEAWGNQSQAKPDHETGLKEDGRLSGMDVPGVGLSLAGSATATSERMDVTAGETAINSPAMAPRRLDDLGSVQDGRKMSTDGQPACGLDTHDGERASAKRVTAGETDSDTCERAAAESGVTAGETATNSSDGLDIPAFLRRRPDRASGEAAP